MNDAAGRAAEIEETAAGKARLTPRDLGLTLNRTAAALQESARLAEEHAEHLARTGRGEEADEERGVARRARQASQQARSHASRYLGLDGDGTGGED
jgi:hypothetical protein